jgi:hypothetical protein
LKKKETGRHLAEKRSGEFLTDSKIRQTYRSLIRKYEDEGKDTSRLRIRLDELEEPLMERFRKNRNGKI